MAMYFKTFLAGIAGALAGALVLIIASTRIGSETGSINLDNVSLEAAALAGFIAGTTWEFRRLQRRRRA